MRQDEGQEKEKEGAFEAAGGPGGEVKDAEEGAAWAVGPGEDAVEMAHDADEREAELDVCTLEQRAELVGAEGHVGGGVKVKLASRSGAVDGMGALLGRAAGRGEAADTEGLAAEAAEEHPGMLVGDAGEGVVGGAGGEDWPQIGGDGGLGRGSGDEGDAGAGAGTECAGAGRWLDGGGRRRGAKRGRSGGCGRWR